MESISGQLRGPPSIEGRLGAIITLLFLYIVYMNDMRAFLNRSVICRGVIKFDHLIYISGELLYF